jgi:mannose-6-phosphate isomerase-like protein (cupin superfamily)
MSVKLVRMCEITANFPRCKIFFAKFCRAERYGSNARKISLAVGKSGGRRDLSSDRLLLRAQRLFIMPQLPGGFMKLLFVVAVTLAALIAAQPSLAQNTFSPDQVKFGPVPPFLPPGAQLAVLEGDPMASSGDFTIRLKMPDGYRVAPHTHPHRENVTVLSGTLKVGMGDQFDAARMMAFPAGSFAYLDPSMHHYAAASGETIIQIHGMSPAKFNYINPADDPTPKK